MKNLSAALAVAALFFAHSASLTAQVDSQKSVTKAGPGRVGLPWDWSHNHLVFSNTNDPAILKKIQKDPRYLQQWLSKNGTTSQRGINGVPISPNAAKAVAQSRPASGRVKKPAAKNDWGVSLGATQFNAVNSGAGPLYPAKYVFDINATPSCINDYVAFPTGALGVADTRSGSPGNGQASIVGFNNLYSTQFGTTGLCGEDGPLVAWAYLNANCPATSSSDPILSSPIISEDGTKVAWVTTTGKVQIVTIGVGFTSEPYAEGALSPACIGAFGVDTNADGASMLTLTLKNAKESGPSVTVSEIFVDYSSDSAYVGDDDGFLHKISPFFTASGSIQEVATSPWQASHSYSAGSLIIDTNGFIEKATAGGTSGSVHPTWSATWNSTKTDNTVTWKNVGSGGGWPLYVTGSSGSKNNSPLNGPVFDSVSKNIFVGDQNGSLYYALDPGASAAVGSCANGQPLYPCVGLPTATTGITAATGAQTDCSSASPGPTCMVMSNTEGIVDPLVVDSADALVITQFSNADGINAAVEQTNTTLSVFHSATLAGELNIAYHDGTFDNTYYSTPGAGYYYLCGPAADTIETALYRVGFTNTSGTIALGTVDTNQLKLTTNGSSGNCSPLTEIYNPNSSVVHDWLFLSLDDHGMGGTCTSGSCVLDFDLEDTPVFTSDSMVTGTHAGYGAGSGGIANMSGTGGIIVDNDANRATYPEASSIYFMPVSNTLTCGDGTSSTGCAVKLTQGGLH